MDVSTFMKSSRDATYVYLKSVYNLTRGCFVLPLVKNIHGLRQSSANWIEFEQYQSNDTKYRLDKSKMVAQFYQPLKLFFDASTVQKGPYEQGEESSKFSIQAAKESGAECCVRIETLVCQGKSTDYQALGLDFDQLEEMI